MDFTSSSGKVPRSHDGGRTFEEGRRACQRSINACILIPTGRGHDRSFLSDLSDGTITIDGKHKPICRGLQV
jgi:hypothetical protein